MRGEGEILLLFFRPIVESLVENHFLCPLQNVFPLQFCQRAEHGEHEAAMRGGCVDVLFQTDKLHALSASIERNLIVTGLYPNEIPREGKEWSGLASAPDIKELFAYVAIINRISFAVFKCKLNSKIISECSTKTVLCVYIPANCPSIARTSNAVFFM